MNKKIKVHIAEDHKILIDGIIALLNTENDFEIVGYSTTGTQVVNWFSNHKADVLILDINMPEMDGIDVLRTFKSRNNKVKTVVLSSLSDPKIVQEIIKLGAYGFIDKTCASDHIIKAIRDVNKNTQYFSDEIKSGLLNLYVSEAKINEEASKANLNEREIEVLKLIAHEKSSIEIGKIMMVSVKTVESYRKSLYKKLKVKNVAGLVMYAVKIKII